MEASILGSILVNVLLIVGSALLASSMVDLTVTHTIAATQLLGCLLFVSVFAFIMPVRTLQNNQKVSFADLVLGADCLCTCLS